MVLLQVMRFIQERSTFLSDIWCCYRVSRNQEWVCSNITSSHTSKINRDEVDYFCTIPDTTPPLACFLSHVHSDHLRGLESLKSPFVYCSLVTKQVLLGLTLNEPNAAVNDPFPTDTSSTGEVPSQNELCERHPRVTEGHLSTPTENLGISAVSDIWRLPAHSDNARNPSHRRRQQILSFGLDIRYA